MEYTRSIKVDIEIDTNKATYNESFESLFESAKYIFEKLSDEQRLEIMADYCKFCGTDNPQCSCMKEE